MKGSHCKEGAAMYGSADALYLVCLNFPLCIRDEGGLAGMWLEDGS